VEKAMSTSAKETVEHAGRTYADTYAVEGDMGLAIVTLSGA
jgi:hypothetical protein